MSIYIVLDLEMCKVPRTARQSFPAARELIQIGAVAMDENYQIIDTFMTYVNPEYGVLDKQIERLTGITFKHIQGAPKASQALSAFYNWMPEDAILVTWSENDIYQIEDELDLKNIDIPEFYDLLDTYIDCQEIFSDKMNNDRAYRLSEALIIADIDFDENIHDALVDAKNTALLFEKTQREDVLLLNPYLITEDQYTGRMQGRFGTPCYSN